MTEEIQASPKNSISEQLGAVLGQLSTDQIRFVVARLEKQTDKEAAESLEMKPDTVYHWKSRDKAPIDEALRLMAEDGLVVAQHVRRRNLAKAMLVKVGGLDSNSENIRQGVATEIIEWEMGKPTQRAELSGKDGGPIETSVTLTDEKRDRALSSLADAIASCIPGVGESGDGAVGTAE